MKNPAHGPNPFFNQAKDYKRKIDPIGDYVTIQATYLSTRYGRPYEECREFVKRTISSGGSHPVQDPEITYLGKKDNGDMAILKGTFMGYLREEVAAGAVIAPTMTTYTPESVMPSKLLKKIELNGKIRGVAKKAAFVAKSEGNKTLFNIQNNVQTQVKRSSNAISGAQNTPSTPLFNPSGHSTLTSICRITAGYGNANNEVFLSGNRHYYSYEIVANHFATILAKIDREAVSGVVARYALEVPSAQSVMAMVDRCTARYIHDRVKRAKIEAFVDSLSDLDRVCVMYCGDFFQLREHNPDLVRKFLGQLSAKAIGSQMENPIAYIKGVNEEYVNLAHQICTKETAGIAKEYGKIKDPQDLQNLAWTIHNIDSVVTEYADLIRAFYVTDIMPQAVASFHESVRDVVNIGDTDSTIFTVMEWVKWWFGDYLNGPETVPITATMCFLAASTVVHLLATMSANIGIPEKRIFEVAMKSEFRFDVLVPTWLGKHYWASKGCQEGCVFVTHEEEEKGVNLISSAVPQYVNDKAAEMRTMVLNAAWNNQKLKLADVLQFVADVEKHIVDDIRQGGTTYLRSGTVKDPRSYSKNMHLSPYQIHTGWEEVFAPKYGHVSPPPYVTFKVNLNLNNATRVRQWLAGMEDRAMAERLVAWYFTDREIVEGDELIVKKAKPDFNVFTIPSQALWSFGFPKEIIEVIAYRQILSDICKALYIQLEALGWHCMRGAVQRFPSEQYLRSLGI